MEVLAELLHLDRHIRDADIVIVGERSLDEQSRFGKTPVGIARRARDLGVPAIAVVGTTTLGESDLAGDGITDIVSAVRQAAPVGAASAEPVRHVEAAAAVARERVHRRRGGDVRSG